MGNEGLNPGVEIGSTEGVEQNIETQPQSQTVESEASDNQEIIEHKSEPVGEAPKVKTINSNIEEGSPKKAVDEHLSVEGVFNNSEKSSPDKTENMIMAIIEANSKKDAA